MKKIFFALLLLTSIIYSQKGEYGFTVKGGMNFDISSQYHYIFNEDVHNLGDEGYATTYSTSNFISVYAGINIFFR